MTIGEEVWLLERRYVNGFVSPVAPPLCVSSRAKKLFLLQLVSFLIFTLSQLGIFSLPASVRKKP